MPALASPEPVASFPSPGARRLPSDNVCKSALRSPQQSTFRMHPRAQAGELGWGQGAWGGWVSSAVLRC